MMPPSGRSGTESRAMPDSGRDIFQVIPPGLFGPLAAPGAAVYARILLALFLEWQKHVQPLSREAALYCVSFVLNDPEAMRLTEDASAPEEGVPPDATPEQAATLEGAGASGATVGENEENATDVPMSLPPEDPVQARAGAILRYLTRRGWLSTETQPDFAQTYLFPGYASRFLKVLGEIAGGGTLTSQSLIFPIFDTLRSAFQEGEIDSRLPQAHRQTGELLVELRELRDNIGAYLDRIVAQMPPREILNQMLTQYRDEIQGRLFHYLHTTEHVSRYRPEVIDVLTQLERSGQIDEAARKLYELKEFPTLQAAQDRLYEQAREIRERFQSLDSLLEAIDVRHSQFVDAAVRSIELHLMSQSTTSGQLNGILEHLLQKKKWTVHQFTTISNSLIQLDQLSWICPESLATPHRIGEPFVPALEVQDVPTDEELERARQGIVLQMQQKLTQERVRQVVGGLLDGRKEVNAEQLPVAGPEDLALVILVRELGREGKFGYVVDELPDARWLEKQGVGFWEFRIRPVPNGAKSAHHAEEENRQTPASTLGKEGPE